MEGDANAANLGWFFFHMASVSDEVETKNELVQFNQSIGQRIELAGNDISAATIVGEVEELLLDAIGGPGHGVLVDEDHENWRNACHAIAWACFDASGEDIAAHGGTRVKSALFASLPNVSERINELANGCALEPVGEKSILAQQPVVPSDDEKKNVDSERSPIEVLGVNGIEDRNTSERGPPHWLTHSLTFDPREHEAFVQQTPKFASLHHGPSSVGKTRLLYRAARVFDPAIFDDDAQTTGDCVSHATANACSTVNAFQILAERSPFEWTARAATEPIYGHRGHSGKGMTVSRAADFINRVGGVPLRIAYGKYNFEHYDSRVGTSWGISGVPRDLVRQLRDHQMTHAALVENTNEARDAIFFGYPLIVGSNASFSFERDKNGFSRQTGPGGENPQGWAHAMAWLAVSTAGELAGDEWNRYGQSPDDACFLIVNSWGPDWIGGPRGRFDIPLGSFWITSREAAFMISQRQTIAVGEFNGYRSPPISRIAFDYLERMKPTNKVPNDLTGLIPIALAAATANGVDDPTLIDSAPKPSPGPKPRPDSNECHRCNGTGIVVMVDGNSSPCQCRITAGFEKRIQELERKWQSEREELKRNVPDDPTAAADGEGSSNWKPKPPKINPGVLHCYESLVNLINDSEQGKFYLVIGSDSCPPCIKLKSEIIQRLNSGERLNVAYSSSTDPKAAKLVKGKALPLLMEVVKTKEGIKRRWIAQLPKTN
jgi:hypothetical protein